MKIEKIEKISKEIKNFANNIDILGIYIHQLNRKRVEIHLSSVRFLNLFKNQVKYMYFLCGEEKWAVVKSIMYCDYVKDYDIELCYQISGIRFFCLINNWYEFKYIKNFIINKTKLFK